MAYCHRVMKSPLLLLTGILIAAGLNLIALQARAQNEAYTHPSTTKTYVTGGIDGAILSFAGRPEAPAATRWIPRFSLFFNVGSTLNKDWGPHAGMFTGLALKNIGLIRKTDSARFKDRVYALGVPLGLKFGQLSEHKFFIVGAEADLAVNFKEKKFQEGQSKTKFNEWFSRRTPLGMPSVFVGMEQHHFDIKFQYYLTNFFRPQFSEMQSGGTQQPYQGLSANVCYLTVGFCFQRHMHLFHSK